jgi:hypothetical protein
MDELDDAEAGAVPRETLPHVETFPVLPSSPAMLGRDELPRQPFTANRMPLAALTVGNSYQVPLNYSEVALRALIVRANKSGEPQYKLIRWPDCYELGRIA